MAHASLLSYQPLVAIGALLSGSMGSPSTGAVLAVELTQDIEAILSLPLASVIAHVFVAANIFQLLPPRRLLE